MPRYVPRCAFPSAPVNAKNRLDSSLAFSTPGTSITGHNNLPKHTILKLGERVAAVQASTMKHTTRDYDALLDAYAQLQREMWDITGKELDRPAPPAYETMQSEE
jgi:hypothetical protein